MVVESATIGSSGVESLMVAEIVASSANNLYTLQTRATKTYRKDHGIPYKRDDDDEEGESSHVVDAKIIYTIATSKPERLRLWKLPTGPRLVRIHRSVRPFDKRGYQADEVDLWMANLPPFTSLPPHLKHMLGKGKNYNRSKALPFAMAFEDQGSETRDGYMRIIGAYDHGYGSYYRRKFTELMQIESKKREGVKKMKDVPWQTRKDVLKLVRRNIRELWHLSVAWQGRKGTTYPVKGTTHPVDVEQKGTMNPETGTRHPDVSRHLSVRLPDDTA